MNARSSYFGDSPHLDEFLELEIVELRKKYLLKKHSNILAEHGYTLIDDLSDGMMCVYRVFNEDGDDLVAKIADEDLHSFGEFEQTENEALISSNYNFPFLANVFSSFDYNKNGERCSISIKEYYYGEVLSEEFIKEHPECVFIFEAYMEELHKNGIVNLDLLRPSNFMNNDGEIIMLDYGTFMEEKTDLDLSKKFKEKDKEDIQKWYDFICS